MVDDGQGDIPQDPNQYEGAGGDENVDAYFDDGGETFLPADHVSTKRNCES